MIIAVSDSKVFHFPNSTIECRIHNGYTEVLVMPERRRFVVRHKLDHMRHLQESHPHRTYNWIATTIIVNDLRNGFIQADEEIF